MDIETSRLNYITALKHDDVNTMILLFQLITLHCLILIQKFLFRNKVFFLLKYCKKIITDVEILMMEFCFHQIKNYLSKSIFDFCYIF